MKVTDRKPLRLAAAIACVFVAALACNAVLGIHDLSEKPGAVDFDASAIDFGAVGCTRGPQTITLTNPKPDPVTWTATLGKGAASPFSLDKMTGTIASQGTDQFTISLKSGDAGADPSGDTLVVTGTDGSSNTVALKRSALGAVVTIAPSSLSIDQPYNAISPPYAVTITNGGEGNATFTLAATVPFSVDPTTATTIGPDASFVAYVRFAPTQEAGASGSLTLTLSNDTINCGTVPSPVALSGNGTNGIVEIAEGTRHECARTSDGRVFCWGNDQYRQLGTGDAGEPPNNNWGTPNQVLGLPAPAVSLGLGLRTSCVAITPRGVACWGWNAASQAGTLGPEFNGPSTLGSPAAIPNLTDVSLPVLAASVVGGAFQTCVRDNQGILYCWGDNFPFGLPAMSFPDYAGLFAIPPTTPISDAGLGTQVAAPYQLPVNTASDFVLGETQAVATFQGVVMSWPHEYDDAGNPYVDDAGNYTDAAVWTPLPVSFGDAGVPTQLTAGGQHFCALMPDTTVLCWGDNSFHQLGDGTTISRQTPAPVSGLSDVIRVQGSVYHSCAIKRDGSVWCWGLNSTGQLGDGTTTDRATPVPVLGLTEPAANVTGCAPGLCNFTCALTVAGHVWCWGDNGWLELGQGNSVIASSPTPLRVQGLP